LSPPTADPASGIPSELPDGIRPGGRYAQWRPAVPRYVVCDVDGTLVGPSAHASAEVTEAVERAQRAGIRVGFATGRMRRAVEPLYEQLAARGPHLLHNGAEVRADGRTVASLTLTPAQIDRLLAIAHDRDDAYLEVYTEDAYHVSAFDERARPHWELLGSSPASVLTSARDLDGAPALKATYAVFDPGAVPEVVEAVRGIGLAAGPAGSPRTPEIIYCNATHPQADKGSALTLACQHLGIEVTAAVAVGDAENDLPMLAVAGTAIAMAQAPEEVLAAAHLVVPDVDHHGVAVALGWAVRSLTGT
jgi:Cof subfamily protein (haloacid dehalogenase superfamily)